MGNEQACVCELFEIAAGNLLRDLIWRVTECGAVDAVPYSEANGGVVKRNQAALRKAELRPHLLKLQPQTFALLHAGKDRASLT
jgi:hypothetical protein